MLVVNRLRLGIDQSQEGLRLLERVQVLEICFAAIVLVVIVFAVLVSPRDLPDVFDLHLVVPELNVVLWLIFLRVVVKSLVITYDHTHVAKTFLWVSEVPGLLLHRRSIKMAYFIDHVQSAISLVTMIQFIEHWVHELIGQAVSEAAGSNPCVPLSEVVRTELQKFREYLLPVFQEVEHAVTLQVYFDAELGSRHDKLVVLTFLLRFIVPVAKELGGQLCVEVVGVPLGAEVLGFKHQIQGHDQLLVELSI